jgi:ribosomal protein S18 acetylase RimI-like enzyme
MAPLRAMEIRRATEADLRPLRALRLRALTEDPHAFGSTPASELARTDEQWAFRFDPGATFAAFAGDGTLAGMVTGLPDPEHDRRVDLISMWVAPEHRGQGCGARLVEAVCDWAAERGDTEVRLDVVVGNAAAERLYERCGFRPTGVVVLTGDGRTEIAMARRLRPRRFS